MLRRINQNCINAVQRLNCAWEAIDRFLCEKEKLIFWSAGLLYKFALDIMYVWASHHRYESGGIILEPDVLKYVISIVMYIFLFKCMPRNEKSAVSGLLHLQFLFTVAPLLTVYALTDGSTYYMLAISACIAVQSAIVRRTSSDAKTVYISGIKNYCTVMMGVLVIFALVVPIFQNGLFTLDAFDTEKVYDIRGSVSYPPGYEYIQHWSAKVILPFALVVFLEQKKFGWAGLMVVFQTVLFLQSGHKAFFLLLAVVIGVYIIAKSGHPIKFMYLGFSALCLLTTLLYQIDGDKTSGIGVSLCTLFGIRFLHGPAINKFGYYELFNVFPKLYFSGGRIGSMLGLTYPYASGEGYILYAYGGGEYMGSNSVTGYLGTSYADMGIVGMLLMSLLLAWILRGLKKYENSKNGAIMLALFAVHIVQLNDASLFTTLLFGGMLFAFLLVVLYMGKRPGGVNNGIQRV